MTKLKLGPLVDDKPVRLTVELPAQVHRDLVVYAEALGQEAGSSVAEPAKLVAPMLARFMATDRAFTKLRRRTELKNKRVDGFVSASGADAEKLGEHG